MNSRQDKGGQVTSFIDAYHLIIHSFNGGKITG